MHAEQEPYYTDSTPSVPISEKVYEQKLKKPISFK